MLDHRCDGCNSLSDVKLPENPLESVIEQLNNKQIQEESDEIQLEHYDIS